MQPSQRDTEGTAGKGLTAVVLLDPFLPDEDPTIYSELVPDPVSGEDYQIRECRSGLIAPGRLQLMRRLRKQMILLA